MKIFVICSLILLSVNAAQFQLTSQFSWPDFANANQVKIYFQNGIFYTLDNLYFNTATGAYGSFAGVQGCSDPSAYYITADMNFYCAEFGAITNITNFNPLTKEVYFVYSSLKKQTARVVGNTMFLFGFAGEQTTIEVFNTTINQFTCIYGPLTDFQYSDIFSTQYELVYNNNVKDRPYFYFAECGLTPNGTKYSNDPLYTVQGGAEFNSSSVFVTLMENDNSDNFVLPFTYSQEGVPTFGEAVHGYDVWVVNDTHFILPSMNNDMDYLYNTLVTVDPNLNFINVSSLTLVGAEYQNFAVTGLTSVFFKTTQGDVIQYDLATKEYVSAYTIAPPIILSNGSILNMTNKGYYLQNPGQPIVFVQSKFSNIFQQPPGNPLIYYNLLINGQICQLSTIDVQASTINFTNFNQCPVGEGYTYILEDVKYNAQGQAYMIYRGNTLIYYIVNESNMVLKYTTTAFLYNSFELNPNNGTFFAILGSLKSLIAKNMDITSGQVLSSFTIQGDVVNYPLALGQGYYLIATANLAVTKIYVFNASSNQFITNFTVSIPLDPLSAQSAQVPLFPLGVNYTNTNIIEGIVCWTRNNIYYYSVDGTSQQLNLNNLKYEKIAPTSQQSFYVLLNDPGKAFIQNYYEITSNVTEIIY